MIALNKIYSGTYKSFTPPNDIDGNLTYLELAIVQRACECIKNALSDNNATHLYWLIENSISWIMVGRIIEHEYKSLDLLISKLNQIAMLFHSISCDLECLKLIQYALKLKPNDSSNYQLLSFLNNLSFSNPFIFSWIIAHNLSCASSICLHISSRCSSI